MATQSNPTPDAPQGQTHAPLPVSIGRSSPDQVIILGADGKYFASVTIFQVPRHMGLLDEDERRANAALIVHAVNTHAQLVAALEGMLRANDPSNWESDDSPDRTRAILKAESKAREALAHARTGGQAQG